MIQPGRLLLPILGLGHIVVAIVLLPTALFLGLFSMLLVIPGLIWLAILGVRLWRPTVRLPGVLRNTHMVLAPFAFLLVLYGFFALRAAERSAEGGGGLLGAFGLIPIVMGLLAGSLSILSLGVSSSAAFRKATGAGQECEGNPDNPPL